MSAHICISGSNSLGLGPASTLRCDLQRGSRPWCPTLLAHAIRFLGLHAGIPAATSDDQLLKPKPKYAPCFAFGSRPSEKGKEKSCQPRLSI